MVSLLELAKVTEEGVRFLSPHDGTPMYVSLSSPGMSSLLTPNLQGYLPPNIPSHFKIQLAPT